MYLPQAVEKFGPALSSCRTPGVKVTRGFLRETKWRLSTDETYSTETLEVGDLVRFFDQLVRFYTVLPLVISPCGVPLKCPQAHDYNLESHSLSDVASIEWLDGPGLKPSDIRARRIKLRVNETHLQTNPHGKIWRVVYSCNNSCCFASSHTASNVLPALTNTDLLGQQMFAFAQERLRVAQASQPELSESGASQSQPVLNGRTPAKRKAIDESHEGGTGDSSQERVEEREDDPDESEHDSASESRRMRREQIPSCEAKLIVSGSPISVTTD